MTRGLAWSLGAQLAAAALAGLLMLGGDRPRPEVEPGGTFAEARVEPPFESQASEAVARAEVEATPPSVRGVTVTPPEAVMLEGIATRVRVVDEYAKAVAGAKVEAWDAQRANASGGAGISWSSYGPEVAGAKPFAAGTADAGGHCTLLIDREYCLVRAMLQGVGASEPVALWHSDLAKPGSRLVVVLREVRFSVLVLNADGSPATGANVSASIGGWMDLPVPRDLQVVGLEPGKDGRCRVAAPEGRRVRLTAQDRYDNYASLTLAAAADMREVELRFGRSSTLSGRLLDANGTPIVGTVYVHSGGANAAGWNPLDCMPVPTTKDGTWQCRASGSGPYELAGNAAGHLLSGFTRVELSDFGQDTRIDVRLERGASVRGTLVRASGSPVPGIRLILTTEAKPEFTLATILGMSAMGGPSTTTDARGAFVLDGVHPKLGHTLTALLGPGVRGNRVLRRGITADDTEIQVVMPDVQASSARIVGTVLRASTTKPVTSFTLAVRSPRGALPPPGAPNVESADGSFTSDSLGLGETYRLMVTSAGLASAVIDLEVTQPQQHVDVRLEELGKLEVIALDPGGHPAGLAWVSIAAKNDPERQGWFAPKRTGDSGRATFSGLQPGDYAARAWRPSGEPRDTACVVLPGQKNEVRVPIANGGARR